jgi:hypothetical protein
MAAPEGSGLFVGNDLTKGITPSTSVPHQHLLGKDPNDEDDDSHLSNSRHTRHSPNPVEKEERAGQ